jgi:hypothetical protein
VICKDCYFYDVCHSRIINGYGVVDINCKHFKNKDYVVELPVELGSIAYCDAFLNGFIQECRVIAVHIHDEPSRYRKSYVLVRLPSGGSAKILVKDIPERLFSAKESAKKKVKDEINNEKDI